MYPLDIVGRVDMFRFTMNIVGIDHDSTFFFFLRYIQPVQRLATIVTAILISPGPHFIALVITSHEILCSYSGDNNYTFSYQYGADYILL